MYKPLMSSESELSDLAAMQGWRIVMTLMQDMTHLHNSKVGKTKNTHKGVKKKSQKQH